MNARTLLAAALVVATACRAASGELSAETLLPVHESRDAYTPAAAWGQDCFLVVWQSGRLAPGDLRNGFVGQGDIAGCRVDKSGKVLDAQPLLISGAKELQEQPQLAFGGGGFLVVWQDYRNGKDYDVYAARVSPEGKVLDPEGILVSGGEHNQALPRVCWDGKNFFVVWQDFRSNKFYHSYGSRVSTDGKVLDPAGVKLGGSDKFHALTPAAASRGQRTSMVIWTGDHPNGAPQSEAGSITLFVEDGRVTNPEAYRHKNDRSGTGPAAGTGAILIAGTDAYLAAWTTDTPSGRGNASAASTVALYDSGGRCIKSLLVAAGEGEGARIRFPEAAWDGSNFVVAWHQLYQKGRGKTVPVVEQVFATRISPKGEMLGAPAEVAGSEASPACEACVASDGAGTSLLAYEKQPAAADTPITIGFRTLTAK